MPAVMSLYMEPTPFGDISLLDVEELDTFMLDDSPTPTTLQMDIEEALRDG